MYLFKIGKKETCLIDSWDRETLESQYAYTVAVVFRSLKKKKRIEINFSLRGIRVGLRAGRFVCSS